jgi:GNAT superfamily N-acetyltransferase
MTPDAEPLPYLLRPATAADAVFIYQVRVDGLREHVARIWGWDEAAQAARFQATFAPACYQVIVVAGHDVGAVAVEWRDDLVVLADIEVGPAWRGCGLGTAIIADILGEARRRGLPVALQVLRGNPARRLYARLGFRVIAETDSHVQMRAESTRSRHEGDAAGHDDA